MAEGAETRRTRTLPDPVAQPTLTVPQTAVLLGLSRNSTYEAAERGEIPTIRIGRRILVPTARLLDLLRTPAAS